MIGDKLVIEQRHRNYAAKAVESVLTQLNGSKSRVVVSVAGESGSGKSETAQALYEALTEQGIISLILGQDDYFVLPPQTNAMRRRMTVRLEEWVGPQEVNLSMMESHIAAFRQGKKKISKPVVHFEENHIETELLSLEGIQVLITEGTYTTTLSADIRLFINTNFHQTLGHRRARARDETEGTFIEQVLGIEHEIISAHKVLATLVVDPTSVSI